MKNWIAIGIACVLFAGTGCSNGKSTFSESALPPPVSSEGDHLSETTLREMSNYIDEWQNAHNEANRAKAQATGSKLNSKAILHFEGIVRGLESGQPEERRIAAAVLGFMRDALREPDVVRRLVYSVETDRDYRVRNAALISLGHLRNPGTPLEPLSRAIQDTSAPGVVRAHACYAIGKVYTLEKDDPDLRYYHALLHALGDQDPYVRISAVEALGNIREKKAIEYLLGYTLNDSNQDVRLDTLKVLEIFDDRSIIAPVALVLEDDDVTLVQQAIILLSSFPDDPRVAEGFIRVLRKHSEPNARIMVAKELGFCSGTEVDKALLEVISNSTEIGEVRVAAIKSISRRKSKQSVPTLIPLLDEQVNQIPQTALMALHAISGKRTIFNDPYAWEQFFLRAAPPVVFPAGYNFHDPNKRRIPRRRKSISSGGSRSGSSRTRSSSPSRSSSRTSSSRGTSSRDSRNSRSSSSRNSRNNSRSNQSSGFGSFNNRNSGSFGGPNNNSRNRRR